MSKIQAGPAIVASIISIALWANITSQKQNRPSQRTMSIGLEILNLNEKKFAVIEAPSDISVSIAGSAAQIREAAQLGTSGILDLTQAEPGEKSYPVFVIPQTVRELLVNSAITARVKIDTVSTKSVPIEVFAAKSSKETMDNVDVFPRSIYVTGPTSIINNVAHVRVFAEADDRVLQPDGAELIPAVFGTSGEPLTGLMLTTTRSDQPFNAENAKQEVRVKVRMNRTTTPITVPK